MSRSARCLTSPLFASHMPSPLGPLHVGSSCPGSNQHFVDVAPPPVFPWLERPDYGVFGRVEVLCSVAIGALVATAHMTADHTLPEMHPGISHPQTIFAALRRWLHIIYLARVAAPLLLEYMHKPPSKRSPQAGRPLVQNEEPSVFRNSASSGEVSLPRISFLCGNRPNRSTMFLCAAA
jgi:hypothetical protein